METLSGHSHFVQGVAWDPLNIYLASQSCDRSFIHTSRFHLIRPETDRNMLVYHRQANGEKWSLTKRHLKVNVRENTLIMPSKRKPSGTESELPEDLAPMKPWKLFHDETLVSFFRRLTFSPDGSLLLAPAGLMPTPAESGAAAENAVFIFARGSKFKCVRCVMVCLFMSAC